MTDTHYLCGCGHEFEEFLGAFGCPNCEGDEGPATLQNLKAIRNTRWLSRAEFEQEYPAEFIGMDLASEADRTAVRFQLPRLPLFTRQDVESIECQALAKLIQDELLAVYKTGAVGPSTGGTTWFKTQLPELTPIAIALKEIYK